MFKILAVLWIPLSIVATAVALGAAYESLNPGEIAWQPVFETALGHYRALGDALLVPMTDAMKAWTGIPVPPVAGDAAVAYAASASGAAFAGTNFTSREGNLHAFRSSAASMSYPIAILTFVANAVRNRTITRFATEHTLWFVAYAAAVAGLLFTAAHGTGWLGLGG